MNFQVAINKNKFSVHFDLLALGSGASVTSMSLDWNNLLLREELPRTGSNAMDPCNRSVSAVFNTSCTEGLTFLRRLLVHTQSSFPKNPD